MKASFHHPLIGLICALIAVIAGCSEDDNPAAPAADHQPGEEHTFPLGATGDSIRMCWIPAGYFTIGSPEKERDRHSDEGPVHRVNFTEGFWLSKYEITQAQWQKVTGNNPSYFHGDNLPVESVSWDDVQAFESALHDSFRLPSESEWEYACRAGTTTQFYWGEDSAGTELGNYAWYPDNSGDSTHSVGQKRQNPWGLCDMIGNVWEWCEDWYHENYNGAPSDGSAWIDGSSLYRILRGGSWHYDGVGGYRSGDRGRYGQSNTYPSVGFRVVAGFDIP